MPHLIGLLPPEAETVIRDVCRTRKAPLHRLRKSRLRADLENLRLDYASDRFTFRNVAPSLQGTHQLKNTALVLEACSILRDNGLDAVTKKAILDGITHTNWPGRFQIIRADSSPTHVLDVAHNAKGMESFVDTFERIFPGQRAAVIVGFVKRKPHQQMFNSLSRIASSYALVPLQTKRSIDMKEMERTLNWRGIERRRFGSVRTAYRRVLKNSASDDIIVVIGSHYLVGEFLTMIGWK